MGLQYIQDQEGNTTGVIIPIDEWQCLKNKYAELQKEAVEDSSELITWQKKIIDERLKDYYDNSDKISDFDKTLDDFDRET